MLPAVVRGWSHRKRESNQTPGRTLQTRRNVAGRSRVARLGMKLALRLVHEAADMGKFSSVGFTGGEPLIYADEILLIGKTLRKVTLPFTIATAAYWAEQKPQALDLASRLVEVGLRRANISFDPSHAEFISRNAAINAAQCFAELGIEVNVVGTFFTAHEKLEEILPELAARSDINLITKYAAKIGRGAKYAIAPEQYGIRRDLSAFACYRKIYHDLVIFWDGKAYPCCSVFNRATEGIVLGNAYEVSLRELFERLDGSSMFGIMKREGFGRLYETIRQFEPALHAALPSVNDAVSPCNLCHSIFRTPELSAKVHEVFVRYQRQRTAELGETVQTLIGDIPFRNYLTTILSQPKAQGEHHDGPVHVEE
jgi:MoaA/NifB/PqqE/SkfB family radical SAM enzyme